MRRFADTMTWAGDEGLAAEASTDVRLGFIRKTYLLLLVELCLVGAVTSFVIKTPVLLEKVAIPLMSNILIYVLAFLGVSFVSRKLLHGSPSRAVQYAGAGLWIVFLGLLVSPVAWYLTKVTGRPEILLQAFVMTGCVFAGLTAYVFFTKNDFTVWGGALSVITMVAFGGSIVYFLLGGGGGTIYSIIWVVLLGGWVLYDTSNILHHRRPDQYVAASVDLLVDFVFLFLYILNLLMNRD